jgi:hypothetical protein
MHINIKKPFFVFQFTTPSYRRKKSNWKDNGLWYFRIQIGRLVKPWFHYHRFKYPKSGIGVKIRLTDYEIIEKIKEELWIGFYQGQRCDISPDEQKGKHLTYTYLLDFVSRIQQRNNLE